MKPDDLRTGANPVKGSRRDAEFPEIHVQHRLFTGSGRRGGHHTNTGEWRVDDDSIDMTLRRRGGCAPTLDLQLKCTSAELPAGDVIPFPLSRKNYDDLRRPVQSARWLVVMFVPAEPESWLSVEEPHRIIMRKCAWWLSLADFPEVENIESVTVHLPKANLFTPEAVTRKLDGIEALFHTSFQPLQP